jgi:hypothetical protein
VRNRIALALVVGAAALLAAGCASSSSSGPKGSTTKTAAAPARTTEESSCRAVFTASGSEVLEGQDIVEALGELGAKAPFECASLDELDRAAAEELGPELGVAVASAVAELCREQGDVVWIADTTLCRDAARPVSGRSTVLEEDFSAGCGSWTADRTAAAAYSCGHGSYRVLIKNPMRPQHSRLFAERVYRALHVEADTELAASPGEFELQGVTCWVNRDRGYLFLVAPTGEYAVYKEHAATGHRTLLEAGRSESIRSGIGVTNRVAADCRAGKEPTLRLTVNDRAVASVRDRKATASFAGFGVFVAASNPKTDVRFDNVEVTSQ